MGVSGTANLDFGAFPGSSVAYVDVVATGVVSTSAIEAWIRPETTADHTDVDHIAANFRVVAVYVSDNNIRIYGINNNDVMPPLENTQPLGGSTSPKALPARQGSPMLVGVYKVNWVWN